MKVNSYSYRYASAVLSDKALKGAHDEFLTILKNVEVPLYSLERVKVRQRNSSPASFYPVDQKELNKRIENAVIKMGSGWRIRPLVVERSHKGPTTNIKSDFNKDRIQIEVQFGNMARWYTDVFKFQLAYSSDSIDAGILVVATQKFANLIDENVASFERVVRELPWAKMSLTLPILVLGVEPFDYADTAKRYNEAANRFLKKHPLKRVQPFAEAVKKMPTDLKEGDADA